MIFKQMVLKMCDDSEVYRLSTSIMQNLGLWILEFPFQLSRNMYPLMQLHVLDKDWKIN